MRGARRSPRSVQEMLNVLLERDVGDSNSHG